MPSGANTLFSSFPFFSKPRGREISLSRALSALCFVLSALALSVGDVRAQDRPPGVSLGLTMRPGQKTTLLVLPVRGAGGDSVSEMISRDFVNSDRFNVAPSSSAVANDGPLNYPVFEKLAVEGVVQATLLPSGWLRVVLHDVGKRSIVNQKDFPLTGTLGDARWRHGVHSVSDAVESWITGQSGIAATRIAFERDGRIWTVDSDGAGLRAVTSRGLSPDWAPNGRSIVYNVLDGTRNPVLVTDVTTGTQRTLTSATSMQDFSPTVSPDGRTVVFARNSESGTELYAVPFEGGTPRRITVGRGRESIQPSFSPDGQRIVFSSDRSGTNEVYMSDIDGTNVELLTSGSYGDRSDRGGPAWSPDGRLVAYHSLNGGTWQIMTINLRDKSVRQVTTDGRNEDPSWAPDARHLVFTSHRSGSRQLWIVDTETGRSRQLTRGSEARLSSWSPRLTSP